MVASFHRGIGSAGLLRIIDYLGNMGQSVGKSKQHMVASFHRGIGSAGLLRIIDYIWGIWDSLSGSQRRQF